MNKPQKEENKNEKGIKVMLLYPYFLPKTFKSINEIKLEDIKNDIEEYAQKNNLNFLIQNSGHVFIRHNYKVNSVLQKKIYLYKNYNNINNSFHNNNLKENFKLEIKDNKNIIENKKEKIINYNKEDYKLIKNTFIMCFTNKNRISKEQLHLFEKIFLDDNNKIYFAKLILPDNKMRLKKNHKLLTSSSFDDLSKILSISLQHLTSNEYNTCRLLTISSFVYYKIENKNIIYLYEDFIRGIKPCRLWLYEDFWYNFFKIEYEEEIKNKSEPFNLNKFDSNEIISNINDNDQNIIENEKDKILYETISFISEIMVKLKLSKKFIMSIFENKIFIMYELTQAKIEYFKEQIFEKYNKI